jgi:ABC-type polar amino acid transport system ATPase subunit
MASVELKNLKKAYGEAEVIRGIDMQIAMANSACSSARPAAASPRCCG